MRWQNAPTEVPACPRSSTCRSRVCTGWKKHGHVWSAPGRGSPSCTRLTAEAPVLSCRHGAPFVPVGGARSTETLPLD